MAKAIPTLARTEKHAARMAHAKLPAAQPARVTKFARAVTAPTASAATPHATDNATSARKRSARRQPERARTQRRDTRAIPHAAASPATARAHRVLQLAAPTKIARPDSAAFPANAKASRATAITR